MGHERAARPARHRRAALGLAGVLILGGCTLSDERMSGLFADPAAHQYQTCARLVVEAQGHAARKTELEALIARAEREPGGAFVVGQAYRPGYLTAVAHLRLIAQAAHERGCTDPALQQTLRNALAGETQGTAASR